MVAAELLGVFLVAVVVDLQVWSNKINSPSTPIVSLSLVPSPGYQSSHAGASLSELISPFPLPPLRSKPSHTESPAPPPTVDPAPSNQASLPPSTPGPLRIYRHQLNSKPPTGIENDDYLLTDASINLIFGSSVMFLLDDIFSHYKPTHGEALPHHCVRDASTAIHRRPALLQLLRSMDLFVIGLFHKGLHVIVLL
jgi:hypothetical protein